jgi:hypothetical protein
MKYFRSNQKGDDAIVLNDKLLDQKKLKELAQIAPKSGDTGADSHEEKDPDMSLNDIMKEFMEFTEGDNTGISRALKEHYNWKNELAHMDDDAPINDKDEVKLEDEKVDSDSDKPKNNIQTGSSNSPAHEVRVEKEPSSPENVDSDEEYHDLNENMNDFTDKSMGFLKMGKKSEIAKDENIDDIPLRASKCLSEGNLQPQEMEKATLDELQVPLTASIGKAKSEILTDKKLRK